MPVGQKSGTEVRERKNAQATQGLVASQGLKGLNMAHRAGEAWNIFLQGIGSRKCP
jgi:hypothetical protein